MGAQVIAWLLSEFGGWLAGAGAVIVALVTAWWRGRSSAKQQTALEAAEAYAKTRKGMDDADAEISDDPHVLRSALSVRPPDTK